MVFLFVCIVILFLVMTMLPFVLSLRVPKGEKGTLVVRSDNKKDPRYFVKSFREIMEKALDGDGGDGVLRLSKDEPYIRGEELGRYVRNGRIGMLVISAGDLKTSEAFIFEKEIYVKNRAQIASGSVLRAITAYDVILGVNCVIYRWSDAEHKMTVFPGASLGSSCTSSQYLEISEGCTFLKLYAPIVEVVNRTVLTKEREPVSAPEDFMVLPVMEDIVLNWKKVAADDKADHSIVTKYRLFVGNHAIVMGHIKSKKGVYLGRGAVVYGNIFAEKAVVMEEGCRVYGNVFSQNCIYVGPGCIIGREGKTKSVIGRQSVILGEGCAVFGYIGCEHKGRTVDRTEFGKMLRKMKEA